MSSNKDNNTTIQQNNKTSPHQHQHLSYIQQSQQSRTSQHHKLSPHQNHHHHHQNHHHHHQPQNVQQQQKLQASPPGDNKNEQQANRDKGIQVDWTMFAEADSQEIKSMFLVNMDDRECETEINKEIKMYRQREFNMLGHLNDYRKRTEDLKRKISLREMQLERLETALLRHKELLVEAKGKERELQFLISDLRLTIEDLNEKHKEEAVLSKLRDAEHGELVDQLKKNIQIHKTSSKHTRKSTEKKSKTTTRSNHKSIDFLASTDEGVQLSQNTTVKLSASLGSISPTRKSFSTFTGSSGSRRRSDDSCKLEEQPFESDSENEIPSDISSSSDGMRHHSKSGRPHRPLQKKSQCGRRPNGDGVGTKSSTGNSGPVNGKSHISRSPNINLHRRHQQEFQNLVPLQHSPQRHRGSSMVTMVTTDERRNMLLTSLVQDMP